MLSEGNLTYTKYAIQISDFCGAIHAIVGIESIDKSLIDFEVVYDILYYNDSNEIKVRNITGKYDKSISKLVKGLKKCLTKVIKNESNKEDKLLYSIKNCIEVFDSKIAKRFIDTTSNVRKKYEVPNIIHSSIIDSLYILNEYISNEIYIKLIEKLETIDIDVIYSPLFYYNVKTGELKTFDEDPEFFFKLFESEKLSVNDLFTTYIVSGKTKYNFVRLISKIVNTVLLNKNIELPDVLPVNSLRIYIPYNVIMKLHEKLGIIEFKIDDKFRYAYDCFIGTYLEDNSTPRVSCMSYEGENVDNFYYVYNCDIAYVCLNLNISEKFCELKEKTGYVDYDGSYIDECNPYYNIIEHVSEIIYSKTVPLTVARCIVYNCKVCDVITPAPINIGEDIKFIDVIYGIDQAKAYLSYQLLINYLSYEYDKILFYNNINKKTALIIKNSKYDLISNVIYDPVIILKTGISYSNMLYCGNCDGYLYVDLITYTDFYDGIVIDTSNIKNGYYSYIIKNCKCCGEPFIFSYFDDEGPPQYEPLVCQKCVNSLIFDFYNKLEDYEYCSSISDLYFIIDDIIVDNVKLIKSVYALYECEAYDQIEFNGKRYIKTINNFYIDEKYRNIHPSIIFAIKSLNLIFKDGKIIENKLSSMFNDSTVSVSIECCNYCLKLTDLKDLISMTYVVISNGSSEKILNIKEFYEQLIDYEYEKYKFIGNGLSNVSLNDIIIYYLVFYTLMFIYYNDIVKTYGALGQYTYIIPEHIKNMSNDINLKTNVTIFDLINKSLTEYIKDYNSIYEYEYKDDLFALMNVSNIVNYGPLSIYAHGRNPIFINYTFSNIVLNDIYSKNSNDVKSKLPIEFMFIRGISKETSTLVYGCNIFEDDDYLIYFPLIIQSLYGQYILILFSNGEKIKYISPLQICFEDIDTIDSIYYLLYKTIFYNMESSKILEIEDYKNWNIYKKLEKQIAFEIMCDNIHKIENFKLNNLTLSFCINSLYDYIQFNSDNKIYESLCKNIFDKIKDNAYFSLYYRYIGKKIEDYISFITKITDCMHIK